jgi:hypothetical protein
MTQECRVCLGEHDEEIHSATLSVRGWFREQVLQSFYDDGVLPVLDGSAEEIGIAVSAA